MSDKLQSLLQQLANHPSVIADQDLQDLCQAITNETGSQVENNTSTTITTATIDPKTGCYLFEDDAGFFCPNCLDNRQQKINTKRLNSKLRVCPSCRSSITPQLS